MGLNPKAASSKRDPWATEAMNAEVFVLLVKLAGVVLLLLVDVVVLASVNFPP
jgi:hypothetical protein